MKCYDDASLRYESTSALYISYFAAELPAGGMRLGACVHESMRYTSGLDVVDQFSQGIRWGGCVHDNWSAERYSQSVSA